MGRAARFSPDGNKIATCSEEDNDFKIWDATSPTFDLLIAVTNYGKMTDI